MTESTIVLECDSCGIRRQTGLGEQLDAMRERLVDVGWYVNAARDYDLCPACTHKGPPTGGAS